MLKWVLWVQDVCTEGGVLKRVVEVQTEEAGIKFQVYGSMLRAGGNGLTKIIFVAK